MRRTVPGFLVHYAQGLLMGGADIIPGVSGGTMALIVGIYERLISSISSAFSIVLSLIRADAAALRQHARDVEWRLVVPLLLGIVTAIVIVARFMPFLLETYPHQMRGLFLGLVAASIAVPWMRIGRLTLRLIVIAIAMAITAFLIVGLPLLEPQLEPSLLRVFASAAIAICAMILPGVSGAFLLEVFGMYRPTTEALSAAVGLDGGAMLYVGVFILGAAIGLGVFSKSLRWLLDRYHDYTMAALIGLMAGSLRALWPWQDWHLHERNLLLPQTGDPVASVILLVVVGAAAVGTLTWLGTARGSKGLAPKETTR